MIDGLNSINTSPNLEEAVGLLKKSAQKGSAQAQHYFGLICEYGRGVPQDFILAKSYYMKAAEQHNIESIYNLALMHMFGRPGGIAQDFRMALALLQQAAQRSHGPSIYYLGVMKINGHGTFVDYEEALNWFDRAASIGDYRVAEKAAKSYRELSNLIIQAKKVNDKIMQTYIDMNTDPRAEFVI